MSVDMFTSLNNDILQYILYEWLDIQDICQLDIAVCNHSIRQLYYEALQSSISPLNDSKREVTEERFFELIQWSKHRKIKNPIETIDLRTSFMGFWEKNFTDLTPKQIYQLSNDFKSLKFVKSIIIDHWDSFLFYAFASLSNLTSLQLNEFEIDSDQLAGLGFLFRQLPLLESISLREITFEPILLTLLSEIPSLKHLEIYDFTRSNDFMKELYKLTQLESLTLSSKGINHGYWNFSFLLTFSQLTKLNIQLCHVSILDILPLTQLKKLEFEYVDFEDIDINYENYLPFHQLESIVINETNVKQDFIQFILRSKQLKEIKLLSCSDLQSSLFYGIDIYTNLTHLILRHINIDEQLFDNICKLSQLKELDLYGDKNPTNKQNICLPFSKLSKQLSYLDFIDQPYIINKNTFEEISQLQNLTELSFSWNADSLEELQPLSQLKQLTSLHLMYLSKFQTSLSKEKLEIKIKEMLQLPNLFIHV